MVRKNQTSKEFRRGDDSILYLDNAKYILFRTTQNGSRLRHYLVPSTSGTSLVVIPLETMILAAVLFVPP